MAYERPPVSKSLKVLDSKTIIKTDRWWSAVALIDAFGRNQVALYLWMNKDGKWKRKQKFVVRSQEDWDQLSAAISSLVSHLPEG